jgi:hypothetical protein
MRDEIDAAQDGPVLLDQYMTEVPTVSLQLEQFTMSRLEVREEVVASLRDRGGEMGPILALECKKRWCVLRAETLQSPRWGALTGPVFAHLSALLSGWPVVLSAALLWPAQDVVASTDPRAHGLEPFGASPAR